MNQVENRFPWKFVIISVLRACLLSEQKNKAAPTVSHVTIWRQPVVSEAGADFGNQQGMTVPLQLPQRRRTKLRKRKKSAAVSPSLSGNPSSCHRPVETDLGGSSLNGTNFPVQTLLDPQTRSALE
jgi:hypothetical protein